VTLKGGELRNASSATGNWIFGSVFVVVVVPVAVSSSRGVYKTITNPNSTALECQQRHVWRVVGGGPPPGSGWRKSRSSKTMDDATPSPCNREQYE
jgi:hypothetical protein